MNKFVSSLSIIIFGLSLGYLIQFLANKKMVTFPFSIEKLPRRLQKTALLFLSPIALTGALWILELNDLKLMVLPFIGFTALMLGGVIAFGFGKAQKLSKRQMGAYIISGSFTNIGSIGGLVCYILFGEVGFAIVPLYKLFEELVYYGIGFPLAKSFSSQVSQKESTFKRLRKVFSDVFIIAALISITIGLSLNMLGINRPQVYGTINSILIPISTICLLMSIGLNLRFSKMGQYLKPSFLIILSKMLIVPTIIGSIGYLIGLGDINNGMPLKVIIVLSSMPTGFVSMIPPALYDLDGDLANTIWFTTTLSLIIVIPCLGFITSFL